VTRPRTLVIACGALARELLEIVRLNDLADVTVECLPARLHNRPSEIPDAVRGRIQRARQHIDSSGNTLGLTDDPFETVGGTDDPVDAISTIGEHSTSYDTIFVAYADCGTGGLLRTVCDEEGVEMLDGAHCYEFFARAPRFAEIQDSEIGSFYLTDFLVRHFDRMVWQGLGLDRHPQLLPTYFGNYTRLVYLAQTDDPELLDGARAAAERLGLDMIVERTGYGELEPAMVELRARRT
jgi:hypothetical protein